EQRSRFPAPASLPRLWWYGRAAGAGDGDAADHAAEPARPAPGQHVRRARPAHAPGPGDGSQLDRLPPVEDGRRGFSTPWRPSSFPLVSSPLAVPPAPGRFLPRAKPRSTIALALLQGRPGAKAVHRERTSAKAPISGGPR